jgi:hypothetical protein
MTRAHHVTHRKTTLRVERMRNLVKAMIAGDMTREEIGELLQVGPSGVRKYLADLIDIVGIARYVDGTATFVGFPVYGLVINAKEAQSYMDSLVADAPPRATPEPRSVCALAARDPSRHFHILADDTHYPVRVSRAPVQRDVLVAAFFGAGRHEVRA